MALAAQEKPKDGRKARSERTRNAIVEAMMELIGEGMLQPTSEEVAIRAQVGHRTVFRHFQDMEVLYREIAVRLEAAVFSGVDPIPPTGTVAARIDQMVRTRSTAFEKAKMFHRATIARRWASPFLQKSSKRFSAILHDRLHYTFPELRSCPPGIQAAIELVLSFDAWEELRAGQGLSVARAREAQVAAVCALLKS